MLVTVGALRLVVAVLLNFSRSVASEVSSPLFSVNWPFTVLLMPELLASINVTPVPVLLMVKPLNEVVCEPPITCVLLPLKVTALVSAPGVNVPPLFAQLPDTLNVPEGAVNVPELNVSLVVKTLPVEPVNVPPLIFKPLPLNVCVPVLAR